jgi:hypothetical protein
MPTNPTAALAAIDARKRNNMHGILVKGLINMYCSGNLFVALPGHLLFFSHNSEGAGVAGGKGGQPRAEARS